MKVVLLGTGNVATVLGYRIKNAGHQVIQVFGRTVASVGALAQMLDATACLSYDEMSADADIYIIAVSDRAVAEVAGSLKVNNRALVVHTAGAVSKQVLSGTSEQYGVLYPLQSMQAERKSVLEIPLLLDANSGVALAALEAFAKSVSPIVSIADDDIRSRLHVGAVFTNNFNNYLFTIAQRYCINENLDFSLLYPLIKETANRLQAIAPEASQTGPAIRNDQQTINKHLELLKTYPDAHALYEQLTHSIQHWYGINK